MLMMWFFIADKEATLHDMLSVVASFCNEFSLSSNSKKCGVLNYSSSSSTNLKYDKIFSE